MKYAFASFFNVLLDDGERQALTVSMRSFFPTDGRSLQLPVSSTGATEDQILDFVSKAQRVGLDHVRYSRVIVPFVGKLEFFPGAKME